MFPMDSRQQLKTDGCFIRLLARKIQPCLYRASDHIYKANDFGSEMYYIKKGEVHVLADDESTVLLILRAGVYFGERSLLLEEPRACSARAATNCELYVLSKKSLDETFQYYPAIYEQLQRAADEMKEQEKQEDGPTFRKPEYQDSGYRMAEEEHRGGQWTVAKQTIARLFNTMKRISSKTIDPENTYRVVYQYTSSLLTIILFWAITYMLSLSEVNWNLSLFATIINIFAVIEIVLKFRICYYDDSGTYVSDYTSIYKNYFKRKVGLVFDLVCSLPYGLLVLHQMDNKDRSTFLSLIVYARAAHLPRLITLLVFMWKEERSITSNLLWVRIIKYFVHVVLFVHCGAVVCILFVKIYGVISWAGESEVFNFAEMYRYASYWVIQIYTTTGYGDIAPSTLEEMILCIVVMILSKMLVIYAIGRLSSTQTNKRVHQVAYEEKLETIKTYMKEEKMQQKRVMQFYNYRWNRTNGRDAEDLLKGIPHCMKMEILSRICLEILRKHQLFSYNPEPFLRELCSRMIIRCFPVGEFIYRKGDVTTGMYLILIGKVKLCRDTRGTKIIRRLSAGTVLGEQFLLKQTLFRDTAIAEDYVDVAVLSKESFDAVGLIYPDVISKLEK